MHFTIRLDDGGADDLRDLWAWLADEDDLRGHVTMAERPPANGELGPVAEAVIAALAPGGAVVVLVGAVLNWLRYRRGDVSVSIERGVDKASVRVGATRVRGLDQAGVTALVREVTDAIATDGSGTPEPPRGVISGRGD